MTPLFYLLIFFILIFYINKTCKKNNLDDSTNSDKTINLDDLTNSDGTINLDDLTNLDRIINLNLINLEDNYYSIFTNNLNIDINYDDINKKIVYENNNYNLIGSAINKYYNLYYLLYEYNFTDDQLNIENTNKNYLYNVPSNKRNNLYYNYYPNKIELLNLLDNNRYLEDKLYNYLLVELKDLKKKPIKYIIKHKIGPRLKININDYVIFSYNNFQIGPLIIYPLK